MMLAALVCTVIPSAQSGAHIFGRVVDVSGAALPGVTITATVDGRSMRALTDGDGRYQLTDVIPGECRVQAQLPGFWTAEKTVALSAGGERQVDFEMRVGCPSNPPLVVVGPLREMYERSLAVVVVRVDGAPRPCVDGNGCACEEQSFSVERVIKGPELLVGRTLRGEFYPGRGYATLTDDRFVAFLTERGFNRGEPMTLASVRLRIREGNVLLNSTESVELGAPENVVALAEFIDRLQRPK